MNFLYFLYINLLSRIYSSELILDLLSVFFTQTHSWFPIKTFHPSSNCTCHPFHSSFPSTSPRVTASHPLYFCFSAQLLLLPFTSSTSSTSLTSFPSCVCTDFLGFLSAPATCVVAMFMCLYISEHLLFQQGPHGLKCQSRAAARLLLCLLPVPALLVV